ncbi:enoyl-CoA hydratase-related protein [Thermodesulfobacteriota bacterium]
MTDYSRYECIQVEEEDTVLTVTLNRPESLNAFSSDLHREMEDLWADVALDLDVNAVILTGAGKAFSAGGDVKDMARRAGTDEGRQRALTTSAGARRLIQNMLEVNQPIIGAINGDAVGLGATVALFCDVVVAAENARIGDPHVKVGVVAGDGGAVIWPLLIGVARAKEYLMTGRLIKAVDAERIGLVNYAVPKEEVFPRAKELAQELAEGPPWAIRWTKLSVNKWLKEQVNLILDASLAFEMLTFGTADHKEATQAFVEKRKPNFRGI